MQTKLAALNRRITELIEERNALIRQLRRGCKHLRLVEIAYDCLYSGAPPFRICADCGAEERGWHCGYKVLALRSECTNILLPEVERAIIRITSDSAVFYSYRKDGPLYRVGQSHPNFVGIGRKIYEQLTSV
ncbi:MAG: hypothetical protein HYT62_02040 [Candidatus Yanofskybacteria bacterium]|nr:hypothetical protein [Candidatus Yanofskybacteria bacterium]